MCDLKDEGGLDFRDLKAFNLTMVAKKMLAIGIVSRLADYSSVKK